LPFLGKRPKAVTLELRDLQSSSFLNLRALSGEESIAELMRSIRRYGLLHPLIVRKVAHIEQKAAEKPAFEIVCGHRRYSACKNLGIRSASCVELVLSNQEALEVALTENIQRKNLDPIEEAEGFKLYISSYGRGSVSRLAKKLGKSEEYVSHRLLLLGLPAKVKERISRRLLNASLATELVWLKDPDKQLEIADAAMDDHLSFRQVRRAVGILKEERVPTREAIERAVRVTVEPIQPIADLGGGLRAWTGESDETEESADKTVGEKDLLSRAILTMRTCLAGLDLLVELTETSDVKDVMIRQRYSVHTSLDELIRASTAYRKRGKHMVQTQKARLA
jgi:ParB/RepB/Spo0J family partition protein